MSSDLDIFALDATSVVTWVGVLVPLLVDLITKRYTTARVKTVTNLVASIVLGGLAYALTTDGALDLKGFINGAVNVFLISLLSYMGWKGVGVAGMNGAISRATGQKGIGTPAAPIVTPDLPTTSSSAAGLPTSVAASDVASSSGAAAVETDHEVDDTYQGRHDAGLTQTGVIVIALVVVVVVVLLVSGAFSMSVGR